MAASTSLVAAGSSERVKVIVRSRPLSEKEKSDGHEAVVQIHLDRREVEVWRPSIAHSSLCSPDAQDAKVFSFDAVYDHRITQAELYDDAFKDLVTSVLEGFNGTIFAYGQTGTGKTYTMEGLRDIQPEQGVIPNAFRHIFRHVAENSNKQYLIRASYLEIYQEEIRDLLSKDRKQHRELRESPNSGVYVKDLSTFLCSNFCEINDLMNRGNKNRAVGATNMNEHSSRSHAIFMITIEMSEKWADGRNHFKVGKLNLVDLAGSERQGKTGAVGERLKESTKINLSLSALGNVIAALVDGKSTHVPYRDSKLTRILQDSLGGNSKTIMVATIGPASYNLEETITTLRYASRAKKIKNKPKVNEDPKDALLRQYQEEIERLRSELEAKKAKQQALVMTSHSEPSQDNLRRKKNRCHTGNSSTASSSGSNSAIDLQKVAEEQRLRELAPLLEPYGLDPTTEPHLIMAALEKRRKELLQDNITMKAEKDILLKKLDETEKLVGNMEEECCKLVARIGWLESKVLTGGKDLVDHTNEQQKLLQAKQQEIAEQIERYEEMKKRLQEEELTIEELRVNADDLENELEARATKHKKLGHKCQTIREEIAKSQEVHSKNTVELETVLMELRKEVALKKLIIGNFIPPSSRKQIVKRINWDEDEQLYKITPPEPCTEIKRPEIDKSTDLPLLSLSNSGEVSLLRNVHSCDENVLQLNPELPKRRTKDYVPPATDPYVTFLLKKAFEDVEKDVIIDLTSSGCSRASSVCASHFPQQSKDCFKVGDTLVKRIKPVKPVDGIQYQDFAVISPSNLDRCNVTECTPLEMLSLSPAFVGTCNRLSNTSQCNSPASPGQLQIQSPQPQPQQKPRRPMTQQSRASVPQTKYTNKPNNCMSDHLFRK